MIQRIQSVLLPALRAEMPGTTFVSWFTGVDLRTYPFVMIRREGGTAKDIDWLDRPNVEVSAFSADGLVEAEQLYYDVRHALWRMVRNQSGGPSGYLHSFNEIIGPTQVDSPFEGTWRVLGVIRFGLRPPQ